MPSRIGRVGSAPPKEAVRRIPKLEFDSPVQLDGPTAATGLYRPKKRFVRDIGASDETADAVERIGHRHADSKESAFPLSEWKFLIHSEDLAHAVRAAHVGEKSWGCAHAQGNATFRRNGRERCRIEIRRAREHVNLRGCSTEGQRLARDNVRPNPGGKPIGNSQTRVCDIERIPGPIVMNRRQLPASEDPVSPLQIEASSLSDRGFVYPRQFKILRMVESRYGPL